jgi:signal transduction histidine kinase
VDEGKVLGVVSFTSLQGGRMLNQADLATAEVFASLLTLAISNQNLHRELVEKERLATVGATMSSITHCMKNVLTILKGSTMIVEMGLERSDLEQVSLGFSLTRKGVSRMESLAMDLLDYCKGREPDLVMANLPAVLSDVAESFEAINHQGLHRLEMTISVTDPVPLDISRFQRAVLNLISNSMDASPNGCRILLSGRVADREFVFEVEDDGPGVPPEKLENIFEPFFSTKGSKGTGLGLAMVAKFCEECGGRVEAARSERLGGLLVRMTFPSVDIA